MNLYERFARQARSRPDDAAVVDPDGEDVTAAVVGDDSLTADDVRDFSEEYPGLAGYEKPRRIEFVDSFPRTGSQKVDKAALADDLEWG